MKIHDKIIQGSDEWMALRSTLPTASEFSVLVTPKKREIAKGDGVTSFLYRKLASRWLGRPLDVVNVGFAGDQGKLLEEEAIPRFELDTRLETKQVGFVTSDDGKSGCSPDTMLAIDGEVIRGGAEIKCPRPETHTGYLLENRVPPDYVGQVQGSMLVTNAPVWWFMSYCRGFPPLILRVERDEEYLATLSEALDAFNARLETAYAKLLELNDGPPERTVLPQRDYFAEHYSDPFEEIPL